MISRSRFLPFPGVALRIALAALAIAITCSGAAWGKAQQTSDTGDAKLDMLNQGYSLLYKNASGLQYADKVFLIKFENDATQKVVTDTSDYMAKLSQQLEQLSRDYPSIRLDLKPLPAIERKSRDAANASRIKSFAPVVGRTGANFERTLLLTLSGGLNQMRHLARVMAQQERSTQRRKFLENAEDRINDHYQAILKLLNAQYYKHDTYKPGEN